ncbi:MAG: metallophosphoesterase [Solobacterium sp.]|nr:metallophosphoesterase [Solobacterium sp.]
MKKLIVISDSHINTEAMPVILKQEADYHIHCGDHMMEPEDMKGWTAVAGNWDDPQKFPLQIILEAEGHRILILHGHTLFPSYRVDYQALVNAAKKNDCDTVLFGHSHEFCNWRIGGIRLINPGSVWLNADGSPGCYAEITIDRRKMTAERRNYADLLYPADNG